VAPARAVLSFVFTAAAPPALGAAAVLAAFPREDAPEPPVSAATGLGAAFRAGPRFAPAGLAAAFGPPARPLPAVPWPPVLAAAVGAAPCRFETTLVLLLSFNGAPAGRALPAAGFAAALPRAGAPACDLALLPVPVAARLAGLFPSLIGVLAIGSLRSFADVAPNHPRLFQERSQACERPVQERRCSDLMNAASKPTSARFPAWHRHSSPQRRASDR
jgi:hypothetical protein